MIPRPEQSVSRVCIQIFTEGKSGKEWEKEWSESPEIGRTTTGIGHEKFAVKTACLIAKLAPMQSPSLTGIVQLESIRGPASFR